MRSTDRSPGLICRVLMATALAVPALVVGNSGTPVSAAPRPFTIQHVGEGMGVSSVSGDDRFVLTFEQSEDRWVRRSIQNGTAVEVGGTGQLDTDGSNLWRVVDPEGLVREAVGGGSTTLGQVLSSEGDWSVHSIVGVGVDEVVIFGTNGALAQVANFVYTPSTGAVVLQSDAPGPAQPAEHDPFYGAWSASPDGEWVTFWSTDPTIVPGLTGDERRAFRRHLESGTTLLIPTAAEHSNSRLQVYDTGRVVLFEFRTGSMGPQLYFWDGSGSPAAITQGPAGEAASGDVWDGSVDSRPKVNDDATRIVFSSRADNLVPGKGDGSLLQIYVARLLDDRPVFDSAVPRRFADSRNEPTFDGAYRNTGPRASNSFWEIKIAGRGGVASDASAAVVNVTILNGVTSGFATVYPCGTRPIASSLNYVAGSIEPNEVIAKLSSTGTLCVYTQTRADVVVDLVGVAVDSPYTPLTPARYADSRSEPTFDGAFRNTGRRPSDSFWEIQIAGRGDVPASAAAAVVNLTVAGADGPGFATAYPCGDRPVASSLNYVAGTIRPNELVAKLSATGTLCIYTQTVVDVVVDVVGYVSAEATGYTPLVPSRFADSRAEPTFDNRFRNTGQRRSDSTWEIEIAGRGDVPATADAAVLNVTVAGSIGPGFATVFPCGDRPIASSLNYDTGVIRPNELIAQLSPTGTVCVYTQTKVDVIVDVVGHL